ncbi:MAG: N-6 DNA methylase [Verrucomicrobiota bacterium]
MSESLSLAARTRLATIFKQLKAKFPKSDSRLAAVAYAVYVCQSARLSGENLPRQMSATQVALPEYLMGTSVLDYFLSEEADSAADQQPIAYRASRLIEDLAKLNAASLDLVTQEKLTAKWAELPARELPFQLLLLDKLAAPNELVELDPRLPSLVFAYLIRSEDSDPDKPAEIVPPGLAELISKAFPLPSGQAALDLTFGLGGVTAAALVESPGAHFFAQEDQALQAFLGWLRIQIMPGAESVLVQVGDPLTHAFANLAKTRPIDLVYVYQIEPTPKGELLRFLGQSSDQGERIVSLWEASKSRLSQANAELKGVELERDELSHRLQAEARGAQWNFLMREQEQRLKELSYRREELRSMKDHLRGEFEEIDARLCASGREFREAGLSVNRNDGRDLKLLRHAVETVAPSGTVVALVSGRNLLRAHSVRALRAYLTPNQNWLDAVIELPRGVAGAGERVVLLVIRKERADKSVLFVDASRIDAVLKAGSGEPTTDVAAQDFTVQRRQRVEELPEPYIARLAEIIRDRVEYDGVSARVEISLSPDDTVDLRPQQYLRAVHVTLEKLHQKLAASVEQTRKASAALQASRAALGLAPLNPQSGPAAPRPSGN